MKKKVSISEKRAKCLRLEGTLTSYSLELEKRLKDHSGSRESWMDEIRKMLAQTEKDLKEKKIDQAWRCFHAAQRMEVFGMSAEERHTQASILKHETAKISPWRRKAIEELIGDPGSDKYKPPSAEVLTKAIQLKDEHYDNQYYKTRLGRILYRLLFIALAAVTGLIILFMIYGERLGQDEDLPTFFGIILFGLLGAITSAILFTRTQASLSRITEINTNRYIVLSRIVVAVGFTIFIYLLMKSNLFDNIQLFNFSFTVDQNFDYYTIAFVSGFTERLATRGINLFVKREEGVAG